MVFWKNKIPRGRKNYVGFFVASCVGNGCQNSNLMNSKIVTFCTILYVTIHVLQKNYDISKKKNHENEKITWDFLTQAVLETDVGTVI